MKKAFSILTLLICMLIIGCFKVPELTESQAKTIMVNYHSAMQQEDFFAASALVHSKDLKVVRGLIGTSIKSNDLADSILFEKFKDYCEEYSNGLNYDESSDVVLHAAMAKLMLVDSSQPGMRKVMKSMSFSYVNFEMNGSSSATILVIGRYNGREFKETYTLMPDDGEWRIRPNIQYDKGSKNPLQYIFDDEYLEQSKRFWK